MPVTKTDLMSEDFEKFIQNISHEATIQDIYGNKNGGPEMIKAGNGGINRPPQ